MEITAKITLEQLIELITVHLETKGIFVTHDSAEVLRLSLQDTALFPLRIDAELMVMPTPTAPVPSPDGGLGVKSGPTAVEEVPTKPRNPGLGMSELRDHQGVGWTGGIQVEDGPSVRDEMQRLLRESAEREATKPPRK